MTALILFSHGSLLCGSGEALNAHAARLQESHAFDHVAVGYLNYTEPSFAEAVAACAAQGATTITVVPYLLSSGFFVKKMQAETDQMAALYPEISFRFGGSLGTDSRLADALLTAAQNAQPEPAWDAPLTRASAHCRPSAECPLYGTSACPKVPTQ